MDGKAMLGHKVRRFRVEQGLTQAGMAEQLGISASYLNLIERNQRPVTVPLLFRLGQTFDVDLRDFAEDDEQRISAGLSEVFGDPLFEGQRPGGQEIRELARACPTSAQGMLALYKAYRDLWRDMRDAAETETPQDRTVPMNRHDSWVQEVRDYLEAQSNHFPALENAADDFRGDAGLSGDDLRNGLCVWLERTHGLSVRVARTDVMGDAARRFDYHRRRIMLSEALSPTARTFQLAVQIALISFHDLLKAETDKAAMSTDGAAGLLRLHLASYFAGAVLMPYDRFLSAAQELRHDLGALQGRFAVGFEQTCHRLTTLQRPGQRGLPFFFIRVDRAGNISKRLSGGGFHFARFGGACPRFVVHDAFRTPGQIRVQIAEMPDATAFVILARASVGSSWGADASPTYAIALGAPISHADAIVYADGLDVRRQAARTPIGPTCRVCERLDCRDRAHPPLNRQVRIEDHVRRLTPYSFEMK